MSHRTCGRVRGRRPTIQPLDLVWYLRDSLVFRYSVSYLGILVLFH